MSMIRFALAALAVFVFTFLFDFLVHGVLLQQTYKDLASIWRPEAEMQSLMPLMTLVQALMALVLAFIFTRNFEDKGIGEGARYGFYMGVFLAVPQIGAYVFMPIPVSLAAAWAGQAIAWGLLAGIILSLIYKEKAST